MTEPAALKRSADPIVDFITFQHELIEHKLSQLPGPELATVISTDPALFIKMDNLDTFLSYDDGDFILLNHVILQQGDRIFIVPWAQGNRYIVLGKITLLGAVTDATMGHVDTVTGLTGVESHVSVDSTEKWTALAGPLWNKIYGKVGAVYRVLTHIGHSHHSILTGTTGVGGLDSHTHSVTITGDTDIATNPE